MNDLLSSKNLAQMSNNELARLSSEITGRLNNEDWQRMIYDLRMSGHIHNFMEDAPLLMQRFIRLEINLEEELARRSSSAPLLSTVMLKPKRPTGEERQLLAAINSQDDAATMAVDINPLLDISDISFTVRSMLTLRFSLPNLDKDERRNFLTLMGRDLGMAFLWTANRWEDDFLIFVRQQYFTRVYAFSGLRAIEATARLTTEATGELMDWLRRAWFPRRRKKAAEPSPALPLATASTTQPQRPAGLQEAVQQQMLQSQQLQKLVAKLKGEENPPPAPSTTPIETASDAPDSPADGGTPSEGPPPDNDPFTW